MRESSQHFAPTEVQSLPHRAAGAASIMDNYPKSQRQRGFPLPPDCNAVGLPTLLNRFTTMAVNSNSHISSPSMGGESTGKEKYQTCKIGWDY